MCKVSIIMPVYNKGKYVEKAIRSILNQTEKDWELLVIDDGSTDDSYEICNRFRDDRIKLTHTENGGVSRARNIGLEQACGEYVAFVDSDDYLACDYLEKLLTYKQDMIIGGLTKVNSEGNATGKVSPKLSGLKTIKEVADTFYIEQTESGIYGFVASKLVKRKIIEKNKIRFDESIRLAEDYEFFLKIYHCVSEILFCDYSGYYYIQDTENSGIALDDDKIDFWKQIEIQQKAKEFLEKFDSFGKREQELYLKKVTGYVYTIFLWNSELPYEKFVGIYQKLKLAVPDTWDGMRGLSRLCIFFYDSNRIKGIYILFRIRRLVRKICRR